MQHFSLGTQAWPDVSACRASELELVASAGHTVSRDEYVNLGNSAVGALVAYGTSSEYFTPNYRLCTVQAPHVYFITAFGRPNDNDAGVLTELLSFRP